MTKSDIYITDHLRVTVQPFLNSVFVTFTRPLSPAMRRRVLELLKRTQGEPSLGRNGVRSFTVDCNSQSKLYGQDYAVRFLTTTFADELRAALQEPPIGPIPQPAIHENGTSMTFEFLSGLDADRRTLLLSQLEEYLATLNCDVFVNTVGHVRIHPLPGISSDEHQRIVEDATNIMLCFLVDHVW